MSKILSSIHSDVVQLHEHGFVDSLTMRTFDALCLEPVKLYRSEEIKRLRESLNVSQPVFAAFLNVSRKAVQKWEQGEVVPNASAMKLLSIAEKKGLDALR